MLLEQIATGTIFLLVIYDTILGTILVGDAITYIRCIGQIMSNVSGILAQFEFGYKEALYLGLYFDLLKIETVEDNGLEIDNITSIELKNVSYKYSEKEKYASVSYTHLPIAIVFVFGRHIRGDDHPVFRRVAALMCPDVVAVFIIDIDLFFPCPDLKFLSQIFPGHAIMDLVEGEGEILCYFNSLSFKIFKTAGRKRQEGLLLFCCKEIVPGMGSRLLP